MYNKIAFISEEGSYFPNMSPYEYGEFSGDFIPGFDRERFRKLLKFFDIETYKYGRIDLVDIINSNERINWMGRGEGEYYDKIRNRWLEGTYWGGFH